MGFLILLERFMRKVIWIAVTLIFLIWAFVEQTKAEPNVWIQVIGVLLFFYAMMRLSQKVNQSEVKKSEQVDDTTISEQNMKEDERV